MEDVLEENLGLNSIAKVHNTSSLTVKVHFTSPT